MLTVSIRELRTHTKEVIDAAKRGETVKVTYRGEACAEISPIKKKPLTTKSSKEEYVFGMWKDHVETKNVKQYMRELRKGRKVC